MPTDFIAAPNCPDGRLIYAVVRKDGEWGEFFVREYAPIMMDDKRYRYSATFTCNSSFGVYGYHWSHMGAPFAQFIAEISSDYLINKIGGPVKPVAKLIVAGCREEILRRRFNRIINQDKAREAWDFVEECDGEYGDHEIGGVLYRGMPIEMDFEFSTTEYDVSARMFVAKLWPLFVEKMNASN